MGQKTQVKSYIRMKWKKNIIDFPPHPPNGGIPATNVFPGEGNTGFFTFENVGSFE